MGRNHVGMDVSDLYEIKWSDEDQTRYKVDDQVHEVTMEIERFRVKNSPEIIDTIKYTIWGPVMFEEGHSLALKWLPNLVSENCIIASFQKLNQANSFEEYYESLRGFKSPAQTLLLPPNRGT